MATLSNVTDFHVPSTLTVQSAENQGVGVTSSAGPANCLRLRADASMWSENGCQVSLKNVGAQGILHLKELRFCQPVEIRFVDSGTDAAKKVQFINAFKDGFDTVNNSFSLVKKTAIGFADSVSVRPWGLVRSMQNITCSINGSSFQCTPSSFIDSAEAIFGNCRYDEYGATAAPPFTNYGGMRPGAEPGRYQRCVNTSNEEVIYTHYNGNNLDDIVYRFDLVTKLPISIFNYACFPALENVTNNSLDAVALIQDLAFEITYRSSENLIMQWFAQPEMNANSSQAVGLDQFAYFGDDADNALAGGGVEGKVCARRMWDSVVAREATIGDAASKAAGRYVNMLRPFLMYSIYEPMPGRQSVLPSYTLPSVLWTSYKKHVAIPANEPKGRVTWDYIHLVNMPPLICISCCEANKNKGTAIGGRQPTWNKEDGNNAMPGQTHLRRGISWSNVSCKPDLSTLKINLSVKNAVLGSLDGGKTTRYDFYRMYLKYSKTSVSYADWDKYLSGFIVFSPQELCGVGFAHGFSPFTLSISFDFERTAPEQLATPRAYLAGDHTAPKKPDTTHEQAYDITLAMLGEEKVVLTPGECSITRIGFDNSEIQAAYNGAVKRLDEPVLDQFVSQAT